MLVILEADAVCKDLEDGILKHISKDYFLGNLKISVSSFIFCTSAKRVTWFFGMIRS